MADAKDGRDGTLTDEEITTERSLGRRGVVGLLSAGVGAVALATGCGRRRVVQVQTVASGITDSDGGPCADPGGGGRGITGVTDGDGYGGCNDPVNRGRGGGRQVVQVQRAYTGVTDRDSGPGSDPGGYGRGGVRVQVRTGLTDSDRGYGADAGGNGRRGYK
jgi:hypothetical protein